MIGIGRGGEGFVRIKKEPFWGKKLNSKYTSGLNI
jgi:hypothetical protein